MKKFFKKIAIALGLAKKNDEHMVWIILCKSLPQYTKEGTVPESYPCGYIFGTEYEARRFTESLKDRCVGYEVIDILSVKTSSPVTVAKLDYTVSEEHPKITVEYEEL